MVTVQNHHSGVEGNVAVINPDNQRNKKHLKVIQGLGCTQVILGSLITLFGISARIIFHKDYWLTKTGAAIWSGLWFCVTGIVVLSFALRSHKTTLNCASIAFTMISAILSCIDGVLFGIGLVFYGRCEKIKYLYSYTKYTTLLRYHSYSYNYNYGGTLRYNVYFSKPYTSYSYSYKYQFNCDDHQNAGQSIYGVLLLLSIAGFVIALVIAIYCCKACGICYVPVESSDESLPQPLARSTFGEVFTTYSYPQQNAYVLPPYSKEPPFIQNMGATFGGLQQTAPPYSADPPQYYP